MRKIFLFSAFCFILSTLPFTALNAQPGWIQNYQPFYTPYYEYYYKTGNIQILDDGCFVVNGTCTENDEWYYWWSKFGYLIKFDPEGNILWAKKDSLNSSPDTWECESVTFAILPDGGFVSAGEKGFDPAYLYFRDSNGGYENVVYYYNNFNYHTIQVVDGNSLLLGGYSSATSGAFLQKTNLSGEQVWVRDYSSFCSSIESIVEASDGGYALGCFRSNNYQLVKTDTAGTVEWYKSYDYNSQADFINSMIGTSDGGYLLCGYTDYNPGTNGDGGFIVKTDSVGDTLWTRKYNLISTKNAIENLNGYVIFGFNQNGAYLRQTDHLADSMWYRDLPLSGVTYGEQPMQDNEDGFICYMMHDDKLYLIQANEEGIVSVSGNERPDNIQQYLSCHPNPFHSTIHFQITKNFLCNLEIDIYNLKGQLVDQLPVKHTTFISWNAEKYSSGIYLCKLKNNKGEILSTQKITLIK